ncbi:unnamed protein product [Knipowitschia caucasica]
MSSSRSRVGPEESLSVMQELEDRLKEQIDKLEHLRLSALDLREHVSAASRLDLNDAVSDHLLWLNDLSERTDTLHINTTAFVQTNPKPCVWSTGTRGSSLLQTRSNDDAASEMSCNW